MRNKIILCLTFITLISCSKSTVTKNSEFTNSDSLMIHVLRAVIDSTQSYLDIKPELFALIDTMQYHTEFCPDDNIRIGAKSFALTLGELMMDTTLNTPEELQFYLDSVLLKIANVKDTWYIDTPMPEENPELKIMVQHILRPENNINYITDIEVYILGEQQRVVISFPEDALANPTIMFGIESEDFQLDTISFHEDDALALEERTDSTNMTVIFDDRLIDAMLTHPFMFIGYINDDESTTEIEYRFKDCMMLLNKFQEQYNEIEHTRIKNTNTK